MRHDSRGFTLVETFIVAVFAALMMVTLGLLIYTFNKTSGYELAASQSSGSASAILREVEALSLPADAVLQSHTFTTGTYTSSSTALVLEIPSVDSSGAIVSNAYDYAVFYVSSTTLYRRLEANASSVRGTGTKQLSTTVNALTFTYNNADFTQVNTVTVDVQTQSVVKQYNLTLTDHRKEQIVLRNN